MTYRKLGLVRVLWSHPLIIGPPIAPQLVTNGYLNSRSFQKQFNMATTMQITLKIEGIFRADLLNHFRIR